MRYRAPDLAGYVSSSGWCSRQSGGECVSFYKTSTANSGAKQLEPHLVSQALASNDGDFIADTLVGLEVQGQFWVVTFDYDFGGFLNGLRANATLCCAKSSAYVSFNSDGLRLKACGYAYHVGYDFLMSDSSCGGQNCEAFRL